MPISTEHRPFNFDRRSEARNRRRREHENTHQGADRDSGSSHRDDRTDSDCLGTSDGP